MNYNYNLSSDFSAEVNPDCLHRTILEAGFESFTGINIEHETNELNIIFENIISPQDKTILDSIISNHNLGTNCDQEKQISIGSSKVDFTLRHHSSHDYVYSKNTTWEVASTFIYDGALNWNPKKFSIIGSMQEDNTTGYARLYDVTNMKALCTVSWSGTDKIVASTELFSDLPSTTSIIELQFKTSEKNKDAYMYYIALY